MEEDGEEEGAGGGLVPHHLASLVIAPSAIP